MNKTTPTEDRRWISSLIVFLGAALLLAQAISAFAQQPGYSGAVVDSGETLLRSGGSSPTATITVTNTNDSGAGSLRQAISDAASGDTINFSITGTITLTSGQLFIDKKLTIRGPAASLLSVSGNNASGVFSINQGVTATLDGITIKDSPIRTGGGIFNQGALTVSNSTISGNGSEGYGNYGDGGGIFNDSSGTLNLNSSTVSGNISSDYDGNSTGGGIHNRGAMTVNDSTISDNVSNSGGGICNYGTMTVTNSTISGNTIRWSGGGGGGIFNWDPFHSGVTLIIVNSTISDNTGSGVISYCDAGACPGYESLINTIVASNTGFGGNDISGTIETASHNLIGDAASSGGIQNGVNGNIVGVDPLLGPLQNNGGPTLTHALFLGSPATNAGDNCVLTADGCGNGNPALPTDQRGMPRSGNVDMGAFELQSSLSPLTALFDFDGDGRSDVSVFRLSDREWYIDASSDGFSAFQFGLSTDKIVPADYDGDGKADIAIFRDGVWWWINSHDGTIGTVQWGLAGDVNVPADYSGDGRAELAIFRNGDWWIYNLAYGSYYSVHWGIASDKPVPADYDGDNRADVAIYRDGTWSRLNSGTGSIESTQFGLASDRPVVGDYDGDSRADLAVYRDGTWYLLQSRDGFSAFSFGIQSDTAIPADYDGDGKTDAAVFRNGTWYVLNSTGAVTARQFGLANDKPVPAAYLVP